MRVSASTAEGQVKKMVGTLHLKNGGQSLVQIDTIDDGDSWCIEFRVLAATVPISEFKAVVGLDPRDPAVPGNHF